MSSESVKACRPNNKGWAVINETSSPRHVYPAGSTLVILTEGQDNFAKGVFLFVLLLAQLGFWGTFLLSREAQAKGCEFVPHVMSLLNNSPFCK
jgi:hypothetical protein